MKMIHWDPFRELNQPQRPTNGHWTPAVDAIESNGNLILSIDLPGVNKDEVEIDVENGELSIRGKRTLTQPEGEVQLRRRERTSGVFERTFVLPETVDTDEATASYKDGVLTITLPLAESSRPRRVEIHAA
ncbi:MAG: Hsp20/alpha crystallin family protein [Acidobacteriota bacterium]|nr:Hsp20/alpha crystallin family protein [Acidobacteriota bacterium]MDH3785052.1 Hsp20/alpha crystallin family protein [Acidobacteriota bacterium]